MDPREDLKVLGPPDEISTGLVWKVGVFRK